MYSLLEKHPICLRFLHRLICFLSMQQFCQMLWQGKGPQAFLENSVISPMQGYTVIVYTSSNINLSVQFLVSRYF